jgi:hypothetical protein
VEDIGPGRYVITLTPRGGALGTPYAVEVHEHYLRPSTARMVDMAALFVLVFFNLALAVYLYPRTLRHYQGYKLTLWVYAPALFLATLLEFSVVNWP